MLLLAAGTAGGILLGTLLTRIVSARLARSMMLWCAWAGVLVVLGRGFLALAG